MIKKYIISCENLSKDLIESFSILNKNSIELESLDLTYDEIANLKEGSDVLIPIFFNRGINGEYSFQSDYKEFATQLTSIKINFFFVVFFEDNYFKYDTLNNFIFNNDNILNLQELIQDCSLTQKSLLSEFSNKLLCVEDFLSFIEIFSGTSHSGNSNPNYEYLHLQKLDKIDQQLEVLRNLPYFLRTNSIIFRTLTPILTITRKAYNKIKLNKEKFKSKLNNLKKKSLYRELPNPALKKFFDIVNLKVHQKDILINKEDAPHLSIIIPVYGKLDYLYRCLYSISIAKTKIKYEVIVVDDCGPKRVSKKLNVDTGGGILIHTNPSNLGFTNSCNNGAKLARGKYLCFLNSDTIVTDNWADNLINSFKLAKNVGIAGTKLLYEDGSLQEAGGIVFSNGDAANIGKNEPADDSWYKYFKDVDYVSGAALAILKKDFDSLGGFDKRFTPAYYEDTSLCLDVRHKLKKRVVVNPLSLVIHHEGATNGKDESKGFKKFLPINRKKFIEKHSKDLKDYGESFANIWWDRDKYIKGNVLIIDQCIPTPKQDSGSKDMDNILRALLNQNYRPHIFALSNRGETPESYGYYEKGVHCVFGKDNLSFVEFYKKYYSLFSLVIISRVNSYEEVSNVIDKYTPNIKTIFYTVDLHHVRMEAEYERTKSLELQKKSNITKIKEIQAINKCTKSIVLSPKEKNYLINNHGISPEKILEWPLIRSEFEKLNEYKKIKNPRDIIFIGGYRHSPNIEAVRLLENKILPELIHVFEKNNLEFPGIKLYGSQPTSYIKNLENRNLKYVGFIENEADAFAKAKISIAPIPFGAGLKGKTLSSLIYRTPIVGSAYACEGFNNNFPEVLVNSSLDPEEFALNVYKTYLRADKIEYWDLVVQDLNNRFSYNAFLTKMQKDFSDLNL